MMPTFLACDCPVSSTHALKQGLLEDSLLDYRSLLRYPLDSERPKAQSRVWA